MGLLARDRDYLQVSLSVFILLKLRCSKHFLWGFFCADMVKDWNSIKMRTMGSSATGGECSCLRALMQQKLRVIPCSLGDSDLSK